MAYDPVTPSRDPESPLKWVEFSRRVYAVIVVLVIIIAGVSGVLSTRQAQGLLADSLTTEGRAVADAVARAAFVPLTLENSQALTALLESYRGMESVAALRLRDTRGKVVRAAVFYSGKTALAVRAPIVPLAEPGERAGRPIGEVEVTMASDRLDSACRRIAWLNMGVAAALVFLISVVGWFLVRTLVARMRSLVGEARLVEQVRQANAELEAFSYSVSHDLRAPLRAVAGFSQILSRRVGAALDAENREYLGRIDAGAKRMSEIIDDLLALSRVSRRELRRRRVDVSALARAVLAELASRDRSRRVETRVEDGLFDAADETLLRTVLENLLGNAWKYTSKTSEARVEFGRTEGAGRPVFFVRDNGAGFDMAHAGRLFKPFQRLHAEADFEGTGIGLATVQRVVRRHGGTVWAEAGPGRGATFYFTLGGEATI